MKKFIPVLFFVLSLGAFAQEKYVNIESPDENISVAVKLDSSGEAYYSVQYGDYYVLALSRLGVVQQDADFTKKLSLDSVSKLKRVTDNYQLFNAKRYKNSYIANRSIIHFKNAGGERMAIIFQVSNDGVAFRYYFPGKKGDLKKIEKEITSFIVPHNTKGWLQPMSKAKSGWEKVNPCYEEFYEKGIPATTSSRLGAGWVFPALFHTSTNVWLLITEAGVDSNYCASRLENASGEYEYQITFPDPLEIFPGGVNTPQSNCPGIRPGASLLSAASPLLPNQHWAQTWRRLPGRQCHLPNRVSLPGAGRY